MMPSQESVQLRKSFAGWKDAPPQSVEDGRRSWEESVVDVVLPEGVTITPVAAGGVPGAWIDSATGRPQTVFWLHGGGFNAGSINTHREMAARLHLASGTRILLIDYRLAPEHPFPAALEDTLSAYRWLLDQGIAAQQIVIGGDSAGAALAVGALLALRDAITPLPAAVVLLSPWLDLTQSGPTMTSRADIDPMTTQRGLQRAAQFYLGDQDATQPLASPLYGDLHGLPPVLIQVGDHEVLLSDSTRFAERAQAADVSVTLEVWPEMWHVWHGWAGALPEGQQAIERIGQMVRSHLS